MSNPNQSGDAAKSLMEFGAAMARLEPVGNQTQELTERMSDALESTKQMGTELHPDSGIPMLNMTTKLITEYTKRSAGYAAALGSILDEFERERDEIKAKHQL